jgi:hypothetical protein
MIRPTAWVEKKRLGVSGPGTSSNLFLSGNDGLGSCSVDVAPAFKYRRDHSGAASLGDSDVLLDPAPLRRTNSTGHATYRGHPNPEQR